MIGLGPVNGWQRLRDLLQRWPNLLPQIITVDVSLASSPSPEAVVTNTAQAFIDPSGEFYCFHTSVHGFVNSTPPSGVLGNRSAISTWPPFGPPDDWSATVDVSLDSGGLRFSNVPVRVSHIFGSGDRPYYWPVPFIFPGGSTLKLSVSQRTNQPNGNRAFFSFAGFRRMYTDPPLPLDVLLDPFLADTLRGLEAAGRVARVEPYAYGINFQTFDSTVGVQRVAYLPESASVAIADGDFLLCHLMGTVDNPTTTQALEPPDAAFKLAAKSGALRFDDRAIGFRNILGTAREPGQLITPIYIERGDSLTAFVNVNTAIAALTTAPNIWLTFPGVRVFPTARR